MERSETRDSPLSGAIVIDAPGVPPDTSERVVVINTLDVLPDSTRPAPRDDIFELALNGLSWPFTEALRHTVGDTVRWRVFNATATPHPMHLHGFHFAVLARGNGRTDTLYAANALREAVTELVGPGGTFQMRWVPTRAGNWLFHCHIIAHIVPFPARADSVRRNMDAQMAVLHDASMHARDAMSGLVLGIEVRDRASAVTGAARLADTAIAQHLRLFAQQSSAPAVEDTAFARGYALQRGPAVPARDSIVVPGPVLLLVRGERTAITVVNHLSEPTSVHWHGMELESFYDGVSGWSGADARRAPLIAPNDTFVAVMTPPRAGTFMYHPHMDEEDQLESGMFGPLIVLEPGTRFDPATDKLFVLGTSLRDGKRDVTLNGARTFGPMEFHVGMSYRLRFLNINSATGARVLLHTDSVPSSWTPQAKDGASLAQVHVREQPSRLDRLAVGETYDFVWRPAKVLRAELLVHAVDSEASFRVPIVVRR
jgi:FtsP/CotA-like multicopper oxidase with cupredoxin domain